MSHESLAKIVAGLRKLAREIGTDDDCHFKEANAARNEGLKLDSYWAGAIDGHHISSALFLHALDDILPEPEEERCPKCGQVKG